MAGESEDGFVVEHLDMAFADLEFVARVDDSSTGKFGEPACGKVAPVLIVGGDEPSVGFGFFGLCTCFGQRHFVADDGHDEFTGPHFSLVEGAIDDFDALSLLDFLHKGRCCVCARYGKHAAESHENGCKISVLHRFFILFFMMNHNGSVSVLQQVLRQSRKVDYGICRTFPAPGVEYPQPSVRGLHHARIGVFPFMVGLQVSNLGPVRGIGADGNAKRGADTLAS